MSENMLRILTKRAAQLKSLLIGAKIPELVMQDTSGTSLSSYKTGTKYTIIWFWDPDCSHCVVETPKLLEFYKQFKDSLDVEVYAVSLNSDLNLWKKYIRENNLTWINVGGEKANIDYAMVFDLVATPVAYIIDEQKRIIAKNIPVESIKSIILRYEEITKKR
jgi:peroxiredoxin